MTVCNVRNTYFLLRRVHKNNTTHRLLCSYSTHFLLYSYSTHFLLYSYSTHRLLFSALLCSCSTPFICYVVSAVVPSLYTSIPYPAGSSTCPFGSSYPPRPCHSSTSSP